MLPKSFHCSSMYLKSFHLNKLSIESTIVTVICPCSAMSYRQITRRDNKNIFISICSSEEASSSQDPHALPSVPSITLKMKSALLVAAIILVHYSIVVKSTFLAPTQFCQGLPTGSYCNINFPREAIKCPASVSSFCPINYLCSEGLMVDGLYTTSWYAQLHG